MEILMKLKYKSYIMKQTSILTDIIYM